MLKKWLYDDTIQLAHSVDDWEQALSQCALPLLRQQIITPDYLSAMIQNHKASGPWYVLAPGLAMPHARPEEGALGMGLSLLKLEQGIAFSADENDPVDLIIMLAAPDKHSHIEMISGLAALFSSDAVMEKLHWAKTREEIKQLISTF